MRNIKLRGVIIFGLTIIIYLLGAFIAGGLNIALWHVFGKILLAALWVCMFIVVIVVPYDEMKQHLGLN